MKTYFHDKNFALSLVFIMRFTATRKWPILRGGEIPFQGGGGVTQQNFIRGGSAPRSKSLLLDIPFVKETVAPTKTAG